MREAQREQCCQTASSKGAVMNIGAFTFRRKRRKVEYVSVLNTNAK